MGGGCNEMIDVATGYCYEKNLHHQLAQKPFGVSVRVVFFSEA